jgi:1-acyl-sn-glycerol-3-phosphate acyltransferase
MWFYRIVRPWLTGIPWLLYRVRIEGREHLPATGGFVVAPSHRSMMDILFTARVTPRRVRFMGKASLFKVPVLGAFFTALGGFPVARDGTDRKAVRDSVTMLEAGDVLCVYPEGTRQHGRRIQPLQPGAAYLALRAGVPIVPVGIAGAEEILRMHKDPIPRFGRVTIVVGPPIVPEARASGVVPRGKVDAMTAELSEALQVALDAAYELRDGASSS